MESKLGPALAQRLQTNAPGDRLEVQIFLRREPAAAWAPTAEEDLTADRKAVVDGARAAAEQNLSQFRNRVTSLLGPGGDPEAPGSPYRELWNHWINNSLGARVSREALQGLLALPDVELIELVPHANLKDLLHGVAEPLHSPHEPLGKAAAAPQVSRVGALDLWPQIRGSRTLVAVIDTGIDFDHPDLADRKWNGGPSFPHHGFNFEAPGQPPSDQDGHGTRSAGLIAGDGSSGALTTGVAPEATLIALRVGALESQVWSAFEFATIHGADIISMSMGWSSLFYPNYEGWRRACELLLKAGVALICSAGNDGMQSSTPPLQIPRNIAAPAICPPPWLSPVQQAGSLSAAIACGETRLNDHPTAISSHGPGAWEISPFADYPFQGGRQGLLKPDICGPGQGSMTCNPDFRLPGQPLHSYHGQTSAAAAVVAGCAALLVDAAKKAGQPVFPSRIQQALEEGATPIAGQTAKQNNLGSGRVNVSAAYQCGVHKGWW